MAHNIFGKRFLSARNQPAWHRIITPLPEDRDVSVEEALRIGKIDYRYEAVPVGYTLPTGEFRSSGDKFVVLREPAEGDPQWAELGVVSDGYRFIQNVDLARGLDALAKATGWRFETVGALGKGETVFMTLRTGQRSIFGDRLDTYVAVSDGKAGNRALTISIGFVRFVCQNTLLLGESQALSKISIPHDKAVEGEYQFWLDMIGQLQAAQDDYFAQLERLASYKINERQAKAMIASAFTVPVVARAKEKQAESIRQMTAITESARAGLLAKLAPALERQQWCREWTDARRAAAFTCYQRLNAGEEEGAKGGRVVSPDTLASISETPYAALQAITEVVDWGGATPAAVAAASSLFGDGAAVKERAYRAAIKLVD
jgi:phage/plasmid-like protein (TIGR03299 family)